MADATATPGWKNPRRAFIKDAELRRMSDSLETWSKNPSFRTISLQQAGDSTTYDPAHDINVVTPSAVIDGSTTFPPGPNSITTAMLQANAVTIAKLAVDSVGTAQLVADAVTNVKIATDAITTTKILDGSISTPKIIAGAITSATIAAGAIVAGKITAGTIVAADIASAAITTVKLAAGAVTANEIAASAIIASKIGAGEVTASKLETNVALVGGYIQSTSYVAGTSGWRISASGTAELNNVTMRGTLVGALGSAGAASSISFSTNILEIGAEELNMVIGPLDIARLRMYPTGGSNGSLFAKSFGVASLTVDDANNTGANGPFGLTIATVSGTNYMQFSLGSSATPRQFRFVPKLAFGGGAVTDFFLPSLWKSHNNANPSTFIYGEVVTVTTDGSGNATFTYGEGGFPSGTLAVNINSAQGDSVVFTLIGFSATGFTFTIYDPATAGALAGRTEQVSYIAVGY